MTAELYKLRPDESPFGKVFQDALYDLIDEHARRGNMTYGEMIGIIEVVKIDLMLGGCGSGEDDAS